MPKKKTKKRNPLVVSFGGGVDSTAMIIGYAEESIVPDAIIFADVGAEHPETYQHVTETIPWLLEILKFPPLVTVRYELKKPVNGMYKTIEEQCLVNRTLPSAAFGMKKCSQKWKGGPLDAWVSKEFADHIAAGGVVDRAIGYEANETRRGGGQGNADPRFNWVYPLREWGWTREDCIAKIESWSLPEVRKSSCFFCPHSKPSEVRELAQSYPELAARAIAVEDAGLPYAKKVTGLWRRPCKGTRGAQKHPGNWREFLSSEGLLPADSLIRKFRTRLDSKKPERPEDVMPAEVEVFSGPILEVISIHKGDKDWHGGAGWYYTLTDYPDEGSFGPFKKVADLLEAAEQEMEIPGATPDVSSVEVDGKEQWVYGRPERDGWVTGGEISREGLAGYVHIVRAPDDPERMSRSERQKLHGKEKASQKWKADLKPSSKGAWGEKITGLLSDGQGRTFNRICLELSELEYTADVAMGKAPDHALWDLVGEGKVEHTLVSPVLFRKVG